MPSERVQRQIERLLDEAEAAIATSEWDRVRDRANNALALDPENEDAKSYIRAALRAVADASPALVSVSPDESTSAPAALPPPSFVNGRYVVQRFLGEGGKKRVYLAHDTMLDRDVAFALIKTDGLDDTGRQRVTREAQAMGRLGNHPNIVSVYDIGEEDGQHYLVLPLLPGGDVEGVIEKAEEHKLPLEQAIKIASETAQGLEFAHSKGLVHRDIKPGNTWLAEDGRAMLGDFGLAVATDRSRLTQAGMMVGTVNYMPPEQAMGGEVTPQSDLYSLGCMLYEMVCGRPPFVGDESVAIIGQHLNTPPVAPTWHRPDCPPALEVLILRLLEKDPGKRPGSAAEVRQALVSVSLAAEPSMQESQQAADSNPLYRRTFVGRETEVKQLQRAFDAALSGQGGLVMVVGEPGIGKTAICEQLATYAALRGGKALVGHCYEEGSLSLPYLAFVEAMRSYVLAREPDGLRSDLGTGAGDVARIVSEVRDRLAVELRNASDPEDDRDRLLQAVSSFLRNASSVQPLLIVLEDLHWADRGTLDLLQHVARNLTGARLLIVGTYRDVEVDRAHPLSGVLAELRRIDGFQRISLRGLTQDEVHRMMSGLATQDVQWSLAEAVFRQTEGNPLFIQEVVRYIAEEGLVERKGGRWKGTTGEEPLTERIPEGLRDVIGKRLSRLSPETNRVLAIAAVIGRDFDLETLRRTAGLGEEQLLVAIEEAMKIGVLEERPRPGAVSYRFPHAFFRQTLYEETIAPRRLQLHQTVARALEAQYANRREEHATELAEHFAQSTDRGDLAKAVEYGELAAQRAMVVYAYGEAASDFERCLAVQEVLDPEDKGKRCDLLLALGEALLSTGEAQRAAEVVAEEAFSLADDLGDSQRASLAAGLGTRGLGRYYGLGAAQATDSFSRWAERSGKVAGQGVREQLQADLAAAGRLAVQGRIADRWRLLERSLVKARELGEPQMLFEVAVQVMNSVSSPRHMAAQSELAAEVRRWARTGLKPYESAFGPTGFPALLALTSGRRNEAEEFWRELGEVAQRVHDPQAESAFSYAVITLSTLDGHLEEAIAHAMDLKRRSAEAGVPGFGVQGDVQAATRAKLHVGQVQAVVSSILQFFRVSNLADLLADPTPKALRTKLTLALAYEGRITDAGADLSRILAAARRIAPVDDLPLLTLAELLETAVLVSDQASMIELTEILRPYSELNTGFSPVSVARLLGAASALLGKPDEAREYYNQALEVCARIRFRPEIAIIRLGLAELLLDHYPDEHDTAIEHLDFAIAEFQAMKMQPSLERALGHRGLLKA